ncbi:o-succinylbenzoate synthase [Myxococcota bacterium]|nr:o-succinylbenzoate synthase [Myxococcota bacterium]
MRLAGAEVARAILPLREPHTAANATYASRTAVLVRLVDRDGSWGIGEASPLPGAPADDPERAEAALREGAGKMVEAGVGDGLQDLATLPSPSARFALELAAMDLDSRRRRAPIAWAGASPRAARVPVQALIGALDPEGAARRARGAVEAGYGTVKIKVGGAPRDDLRRLEAVRAAVGPGIALRADANGGWSVAEALALMPALADLGLDLLEQPTRGLPALAALRGRGVPIGADEDLAAAQDPAAAFARDPVDVLVLKPTSLGGILSCWELSRLAASLGAEVVVTTALDGAVARAGALVLAASVPNHRGAAGLGTGALLARDLGRGPGAVEGWMTPPAIGLGVEPDPHLEWCPA